MSDNPKTAALEAELAKFKALNRHNVPVKTDPRTQRPLGDHGSWVDALDYALDVLDRGDEALTFLDEWRNGNAHAEFPEFYPWLAQREKRG